MLLVTKKNKTTNFSPSAIFVEDETKIVITNLPAIGRQCCFCVPPFCKCIMGMEVPKIDWHLNSQEASNSSTGHSQTGTTVT